MWKSQLRMWYNSGRIPKLDEAEFIDRDSISRDSAFNIVVRGVRWSSDQNVDSEQPGAYQAPLV